ncbi:hypothetical protein G5I_02692 [Acromyrmex echinatior]|uniref:Uncharacterized protein n=1 Tax=Acromyrmex echinatior TaxID=103372 RepID=F4WB38_ACREC|nr:hypothetical protein G5I_02692 [Acromyrmex echinatior]
MARIPFSASSAFRRVRDERREITDGSTNVWTVGWVLDDKERMLDDGTDHDDRALLGDRGGCRSRGFASQPVAPSLHFRCRRLVASVRALNPALERARRRSTKGDYESLPKDWQARGIKVTSGNRGIISPFSTKKHSCHDAEIEYRRIEFYDAYLKRHAFTLQTLVFTEVYAIRNQAIRTRKPTKIDCVQ